MIREVIHEMPCDKHKEHCDWGYDEYERDKEGSNIGPKDQPSPKEEPLQVREQRLTNQNDALRNIGNSELNRQQLEWLLAE